jgi:hypothetical protein
MVLHLLGVIALSKISISLHPTTMNKIYIKKIHPKSQSEPICETCNIAFIDLNPIEDKKKPD